MGDVHSVVITDEIQIEVCIRIGRVKMSIFDISELKFDDILTLDQDPSGGVDVCVGEKVIARGEISTITAHDGRLCVRIMGPAQP